MGFRHTKYSTLVRWSRQRSHKCRYSWSRNSRFVLTSSKDWNVIVWDLASETDPPKKVTTIRFDAPVASASFHPRNSKIILVLLSVGEAYIVDLRKEHRGRTELCEVQEDESDEENHTPSNKQRAAMTVARFEPSGKHVFIGTSLGYILVFNSRTKTMVAKHRLAGAGILKNLEFSKNGRRLITNSSDRTIRQFTIPTYHSPTTPVSTTSHTPIPNALSSSSTTYNNNHTNPSTPQPLLPTPNLAYIEQELEPTYRFNDPITRTAWHAMSYSPDGQWLAGGAADNAAHKIYIWNIVKQGSFESTLDGGREPLVHLHWHPSKPSIASTTNQGNILIWHCPTPEKWGAFAGGFEEVDENVVYEEREDEFDIEDESTLKLRKQIQEEQPVDIFSFSSTSSTSPSISIPTSTTIKPTTTTPPPPPQLQSQDNYPPGGMGAGEEDEDYIWADQEPDDDLPGWRLKVLMEDEEDI
ncbi:Retinoblastoma-binding protein 5/Swd1 [Abortiporus biennis]